MEISEIIDWNKNQNEHVRIVQKLVKCFCDNLMVKAIDHDTSKYWRNEYEGFLNISSSLKKGPNSEEYKQSLKSDCIKNHYLNNPHHPEHYSNGKKMPIDEAIIMYFDWMSRSIQNSTKEQAIKNFEEYWDSNLSKLIPNQEHLLPFLKNLKKIFPPERCFEFGQKIPF